MSSRVDHINARWWKEDGELGVGGGGRDGGVGVDGVGLGGGGAAGGGAAATATKGAAEGPRQRPPNQ